MAGLAAGPDPDGVHSREELVRELDLLRFRAAPGTGRARVSLAELAARVGTPRSTMHTYITGRTLVPVETLDRIVIALGASPAEQARWSEAWFRVVAAEGEHNRADSPPPAQQLPLDVTEFTGRAADLDALDRLLADETGAVVVVSGTAGVGKSALAVHWAHRVASRFPDGQLHVNLRGYDPDRPAAPLDVLGWFLRALGVATADQPAELAERAARFRSAIAGRRMLVVLDNAHSAEQVRDLLPGAAGCAVLITSRDALSGIVVREGARRIDLDLLPAKESIALLRILIGPVAVADAPVLAELAELCAHLPLALRVAAEHARNHPGVPLDRVTDELRDERGRLDLLDAGGDARTAVRSVFSWSHRRLPAPAARLFELLGAHPGVDFDGYAAAALAGVDLPTARGLLTTLQRAHLVHQDRPLRYAMHDLLRAYAAELCAVSADRGTTATGRLLDYYRQAAGTAMNTLYPAEQQRRPPVVAVGTPVPPVQDRADAQRWLTADRANLLAAIAHAARHGRPEYAGDLAAILWRDLDSRGHTSDALVAHRFALEAARAAHDRDAEATALRNLSTAYRTIGDYENALGQSRLSLAIRRELGDRAGEAATLNSQGIVHGFLGRFDDAIECYQRSLALRRELGDRRGEGATLQNLAVLCMRAGRLDPVLAHLTAAMNLFREVGDRLGESHAMNNTGGFHRDSGRPGEAVRWHEQALLAYRELGSREGEADALNGLACDLALLGEFDDALAHHERALALATEIGHRSMQTDLLNSLGETLDALGRSADSRQSHERARVLAVEAGDGYEHARALRGIGVAYRKSGDDDAAHCCLTTALELFTELGVPAANEVRALLG